jgi:hypothetical protein
MSMNKLIVFSGAFMLASFLGSMPVGAQVVTCDLNDPTLDCDGDGILNGVDVFPTCNDLDPALDCDGDGVLNGVDACPFTVEAATFSFGNMTCNISGLDTVLPSGCTLADSLEASVLDDCDNNPGNHGKFVSCVAKATNLLKKQKVISGAQKGQIQSCAAQSDVGKKSKR